MWQQTQLKHVGLDAFLSPDGSSIVTCGSFGVSVWNPITSAHRHCISNRVSNIAAYGVSDSLIAIVGRSVEVDFYDTIDVWNYHTAKYLYSFPSHGSALPIFDKSGKYLAVTSENGIEIRDAYSGNVKQTLYQTDEFPGDYLSFNYDASMIRSDEGVGSSYWGTARIWNMKDGTLIEKVNGRTSDSSDFPLRFSEKENVLAYHNKKKKSIVFRDVYTKSQVGEIPTEGSIVVIGVPKKNNCITQEKDASIVIWDIQTGKSIFSFNGLSSQTSRIRFNRDSTLLVATDGQNIVVCDITTGKVVKTISLSKEDNVIICSFLTGTDILVTKNNMSYILDWSENKVKNTFLPIMSYQALCYESIGDVVVVSGQMVETRKLSTGELTDELKTVKSSPDERFIGMSDLGEYISKLEYRGDSLYYSLINVKSKKNLSWSIVVPRNRFERFTMNKYSSRIAITSGDSVIAIYDTLGVKLHTIGFEPTSDFHMFFDYKGDILFVTNRDDVKVWNVNTGKVIHSFPSSTSGSYNEKLGKFVTKNPEKIDIWDVHTGKLLKSIENNRKSYYVHYHPTIDNILIYDNSSRTVDVIDIATEKTLYSIRDTTSLVAFYDPQGKYLYFYRIGLYPFGKKQPLYDARSGKLLTYLEGMNGEVVGTMLDFSDNGRYVMSGVEGGDLAVWDLKDVIPTSAENDDTPHAVEHNLLTFSHSDNELKVSVNEPLHHAQNFTIYNVCGQKMQGGIIPSSSSEYTVHYDTLQSGVYYFECTINGNRYVHQFAVIR